MMDDESRKRIEDMEKRSRFPTGIGQIERGQCPLGGQSPMACMMCSCGHMLECHHPHSCEDAECSHWQRELEEDPLYRYAKDEDPL